MTALILAIENHYLEIVKILCDNPKFDVNIKISGAYDVYHFLNHKGYFVQEVKMTLIYYALLFNKQDIVDFLSHHPKIDINAKCIVKVFDIEYSSTQFDSIIFGC